MSESSSCPPAPLKGSTKRPPLGEFLPPIVSLPSSSLHTSTIIFLHGRGSNAKKFAEPLLSTPVTGHLTFRDALPHTKFIFPTAPLMRATKYRRSIIHQWYDGTGDWEPEVRGNMRQSVEYIHGILQREIQLLRNSKSVVLAGISQGCAMSLTSMLLWNGSPLGAVIGICGFMPLNDHLTEILDGRHYNETGEDDDIVFGSESESDGDVGKDKNNTPTPLQMAVAELREEVELPHTLQLPLSFLSTPIFIGHGTEDSNVEYYHGQRAAELLAKMGLPVELHTYDGLGHWYSQEMLGHILVFLSDKADFKNTRVVDDG
ncbi:Acyl-protein thioesterase 2-like protein [Cladobotryum mycophilum]|uniref:Acyl-protein thioesterase 2-like protein n=1 Tax=Cladobotryum mycophilum TaxID=491253 RepID=A0ABR0S6H3_9HYPO